MLPAAVAASAAWAIVLLQRVSGSGTLYTVAEIVVGVAGTAAVLGLLAGRFTRRDRLIGFAALAAVVALLAGPAAYSISAATSATNGTNPTAGPSTGGGMGGMGGGPGGASGSSRTSGTGGRSMGEPPSGGGSAPSGSGTRPSGGETGDGGTGGSETGSDRTGGGQMGGGGTQVSSAMITYLKKHQDGATWLLAVATDQTASSIILESGQPVISMGGWSGSDNAMTLAKLKSLVKSGKLHYIIVSSDGGQGTNSEIATWVTAHGTAVKSSAYSSGSSSTTSSSTSSASSTSSTSSTGGLYRLDASDVD